MKRLLIISPHFPPTNAADMQRVRMSLPYFKEFGWEAEVVVVGHSYNDIVKDPLLLQSIPEWTLIHQVKAFSKKYTAKVGLGSLALRSMWFYRKKVNQLLRRKKFDLIYFSTTEFPICVLGAYWQKKFKIPYVIDMQDPWHSEFYRDKPKHEKPKKYWFSYRLHKYLEPIAMQKVAGLISVSENYINTLSSRYPQLKERPCKVITFGAFEPDFQIAAKNDLSLNLVYPVNNHKINIVYIGRGGYDMQPAAKLLFESFKYGLTRDYDTFKQVHFHFIGTSYAPKGTGKPTIMPVAETLGLIEFVTEHTDRIGFYQSIKNLKKADGLIILGPNDPAYNASKLYPYILANKPLLAVFHQQSSAAKLLEKCNIGNLINFDVEHPIIYHILKNYLAKILQNVNPETNWEAFEPYRARSLTADQVNLFNEIINDSRVV